MPWNGDVSMIVLMGCFNVCRKSLAAYFDEIRTTGAAIHWSMARQLWRTKASFICYRARLLFLFGYPIFSLDLVSPFCLFEYSPCVSSPVFSNIFFARMRQLCCLIWFPPHLEFLYTQFRSPFRGFLILNYFRKTPVSESGVLPGRTHLSVQLTFIPTREIEFFKSNHRVLRLDNLNLHKRDFGSIDFAEALWSDSGQP